MGDVHYMSSKHARNIEDPVYVFVTRGRSGRPPSREKTTRKSYVFDRHPPRRSWCLPPRRMLPPARSTLYVPVIRAEKPRSSDRRSIRHRTTPKLRSGDDTGHWVRPVPHSARVVVVGVEDVADERRCIGDCVSRSADDVVLCWRYR